MKKLREILCLKLKTKLSISATKQATVLQLSWENVQLLNETQFQKGLSLTSFLVFYGAEEKCFDALFQLRWLTGFVCPEYGCRKGC